MSGQPRVCILRAPGTNSDRETGFAFDEAGGKSEFVHLFELLKSPQRLLEFQILCIPGGFSFGDDIGAGVIFASQIQRQLADVCREFLERDTLTLGICNGFQVLLKSGMLPDGSQGEETMKSDKRSTTLTWNNNGKYTARWVHLAVNSPQNVFLRGIKTIEMPLAHAEGRLCVADPAIVSNWEQQGQIALRYCREDGELVDDILDETWNPNGSIANIAGLSDPSGRILGLMPHPERFLSATHHPSWTRRELPESGRGDGYLLFKNAIDYFV